MLMPALTKPPEMVERMRRAARIAVSTLDMIGEHVRPGVSTGELDARCQAHIESMGGVASCIGYHGYRHATCISVNHVVCHGVPGDKLLKHGDSLNIDLVVAVDGWHADTSAMFFAGTPTVAARRLATITREAMMLGIQEVKPGATLGDIGAAIQQHAHKHGCSVVRDFIGHGVGSQMHEKPDVPHYGQRGTGRMLVPGMTFTIEPMINAGRRDVKVLADEWTVVTRDRSLSAQWEHTVHVTETGVEVLTLRDSETDLAAWLAAQPGTGGAGSSST